LGEELEEKPKKTKEKVPVISIKGLNKNFNVGKTSVPVLKDINLDIYFGEFVIIFGQSGCGKSTLLNTITGLEKPTSGTVLLRGLDIYEKSDDERAKLRHDKFGIVYQQSNWIKSLNVVENVEFPLQIAGMKSKRARKRADNILDMFGFKGYEKYIPTELSGGQQQKVNMCRALVSSPWILIADEPTGNLDSVSAADVMYIFKYLNDESKRTIIMVSHNPDNEKYATKIIYMKDGRIEKVTDKHKVEVGDNEGTKDLLEMALELKS
jgi:putative ABC transport system ATP-binding protein